MDHCFIIIGTVVQANKRPHSIRVDRPFHVSQVVLSGSTANESNLSHEVWVQCNNKATLIANLDNHNVTQMRLDLAFGVDDTVAFVVTSMENVEVHFSGYYLSVNEDDIVNEIPVQQLKTPNTPKMPKKSVCHQLFYTFNDGFHYNFTFISTFIFLLFPFSFDSKANSR